MTRSRLEAFSDGVIAVLITILVLELKVPHGVDAAALKPMLPVFLSYVLTAILLAAGSRSRSGRGVGSPPRIFRGSCRVYLPETGKRMP